MLNNIGPKDRPSAPPSRADEVLRGEEDASQTPRTSETDP